MPPALRSVLTLKVRSDLLATAVALNASVRPQDVSVHSWDSNSSQRLDHCSQLLQASALWSRKGGRGQNIVNASRRSLFELHPGRQVLELPSNLLLEELSPTQNPKKPLHVATSEDLIDALGAIGLEYTVEARYRRNKVELSYVRDPALLLLDREEAIKQARETEKELKILRKNAVDQINLKGLLIKYLQHVDPLLKYQARSNATKSADDELDKALLGFLNEGETHLLTIGGRDVTDLMNWAWILSSNTTERAAKRLLALANEGFKNSRGRWSIPLFVFAFLLRRRNSSAEALRSSLTYAWEVLERSETLLEPFPPPEKLAEQALQGKSLTRTHVVKNPDESGTGINEFVFMIMIIRLLRSARRVLPAACESIAVLTTRYLDGLNFRKGVSQTTELNSEDIARLTYMYNTLLKLVSLPASIGPFQSAFQQQQAQFSLLRRMNEFQPPLIVDKRGYRAVISMQLRHKKTLKEREWAQMKARSWPPWKEEKLGIDADIGVEHGNSRAMEALRRSWEAGYAPDNWDAVASVLSGWDTDRSPTIQTRAVHIPREARGEAHGKEARIWTSRIRATRTLDEAWSCFLSYKDQGLRSAGASWVYHQMFVKIVEDAKRLSPENTDLTSSNYPDGQQPLPGDGIEVSAAPQSPQEAVYVRIPPPTLDEFVELMAKDGIRPGEYFLNTMLRNAQTLETGLRYLESSLLPNAQKRVLSDGKPPSTPEDQAALESISPFIFASFIRMLTLFAPKAPDKRGPNQFALQPELFLNLITERTTSAQPDSLQNLSDSMQSSELGSSPRSLGRNSLLEAIKLVLARRPQYQPAWYFLLRALAQRKVVTDVVSRAVDQDYEDIKTWQMTCGLVNEMFDIDLTLDLGCFHMLCTGLEKAIFASERLSRRFRKGRESRGPSDDIRSYVDHILSAGLPLLKEIFKDIVRSKSMQQEIPGSLIAKNSGIDESIEEHDPTEQKSLMSEKSRIDESVEEHDPTESDDIEEDVIKKPRTDSTAFLPPGCLLPRLLEVPHPACLHAFIRVLGHRRDYDGLLDLVEWMSLFANELNAVVGQSSNGHVLMRRCLTAVHVFLERSWINLEKREAEARGEDPSTVCDELEMKAEPAPAGIVKAIKDIVSENRRWGGWPEPHEVVHYCGSGLFI